MEKISPNQEQIRETFDMEHEHCFTCKHCKYDIDKKSCICFRSKLNIKNQYSMVCDWYNK